MAQEGGDGERELVGDIHFHGIKLFFLRDHLVDIWC